MPPSASDEFISPISRCPLKKLKSLDGSNIAVDKKVFINENKTKVIKNYQEIDHLGKGGYGEVKKVHHKLTG